jgi:predicted phosphodiesterase
MRYLVAGDAHGCWYDLQVVIQQAIRKYNIDACIQVGDFGFYVLVFDKNQNLKFNVPVYAIDGNHEQHWWLKESLAKGAGPIWKEKHNLEYVPRGTVWEVDGCKFGFFGGAMNVDRRQEGSSKNRTTNYPLRVEVKEAIKTFNDFGQLDFLITHSCPHSIGVGMEGKSIFLETIERYIETPFGISTGPLNDCGEQALTDLWNGLTLKPKEWIYGHFHQIKQKKVQDTVFTCIGCVDSSGGHEFARPFIIDTQKKTFEAFPSDTLLNSKGFHRTRLYDPSERPFVNKEFVDKNDYPL